MNMILDQTYIGIIFNVIGALIFLIVNLSGMPYQKNYQEEWTKRYWWQGWRPLFKVHPPNEKARWVVKWNHKVVRYGVIPPKHQWNIVGFLYLLAGSLLQVI